MNCQENSFCPDNTQHGRQQSFQPERPTRIFTVAAIASSKAVFTRTIFVTSAPVLPLTALLLALLQNAAFTANFTVSNETELLQAIDDANASGDTSSTITLTDSFSITGSGLSRIEKPLVIDMAGHKLTAHFDTTFDVAEGATLVLDGSFDVIGTTGFNGNMIKKGDGTLRIKGGQSDIFWRVKTEEGLLIFDDGAAVVFGNYFGDVTNTISISDPAAGIRITGPGTVVTNRFTTVLQSDTGASLDVENGATFNTQAFRLGALPDTTGTLNVDDAHVTVDDVYVQAGTGNINVVNGGEVHTTTIGTGVIINVQGQGVEDRGGTGNFLISGPNSRWVNDGFFMMTRGTLRVLDGGSLETAALRAGYFDNQLTKEAIADVLISGAHSRLDVTGHMADAFVIAGGLGDVEKRASLTVSDRATVNVANGFGPIQIATLQDSSGEINIGGRKGEDAEVAGYLNAARVEFGPGHGELNFNHTNNNFNFDIPLVGNGLVTQAGPGRTILTSNQTQFTGLTTVEAGTLTVNRVLGGTVDLKGGRLNGTGVVGSLTQEEGSVIDPGNSIGQLTIDGDYIGNGGLIRIETVLGGDESKTDRLKITGDTSGTANIAVTNLNGVGAPTVQGIKIIDIDGASEATFSLQGDYLLDNQPTVVGGAYAYRLYKNGITTPMDGDWYLRSTMTRIGDEDNGGGSQDDDNNGGGGGGGDSRTGNGKGGGNGHRGGSGGHGARGQRGGNGRNPAPLYQAGVSLYQNYLGILQELNDPLTLQNRTGNRHQNYDVVAYPALDPSRLGERPTVWNRINSAHAHSSPTDATARGTEYSLSSWRYDTGLEGLIFENGGRLIGGISSHHVRTIATVSSPFGSGRLNVTGTGVGATLTWYDESGFYLDGSAQATWYRTDQFSTTASRYLTRDNRGFGYALSAETGVRVNLNERFSVIPQAQLSYSTITFDPYTDSFGARISPKESDSLSARFGLEANYEAFWEDDDGMAGANLYSVMNLHYALMNRNVVNVAGIHFQNEEPKTRASFGFGGSLNWGDGKFTAHAEVTHQFALSGNAGKDHSTKGQLGLRIRF